MNLLNLVAGTATREELVELLRKHDTELVAVKTQNEELRYALKETRQYLPSRVDAPGFRERIDGLIANIASQTAATKTET